MDEQEETNMEYAMVMSPASFCIGLVLSAFLLTAREFTRMQRQQASTFMPDSPTTSRLRQLPLR